MIRATTWVTYPRLGELLRHWTWNVIATFAFVVALQSDVSNGMAQHPASNEGREQHRQDRYVWDFGRSDDAYFNGIPDGWTRVEGRRYPKYVKIKITAKAPQLEDELHAYDRQVVRYWIRARDRLLSLLDSIPSATDPLTDPIWKARTRGLDPILLSPSVPKLVRCWPEIAGLLRQIPALPPSLADAYIDRYLSIQLDGGLAVLESPRVPTSHLFQYRFRCDIMTNGLRHDRAFAELVFFDAANEPILSHETSKVSGTKEFGTHTIDHILPPDNAVKMMVRLVVASAEDGLEDIRGEIGFDNVRIEQFPQMQVVTDEPMGVYVLDQPITTTATLMGLPAEGEQVRFRILDHDGREIATQTIAFATKKTKPASTSAENSNDHTIDPTGIDREKIQASVDWNLPELTVGFYRVTASLVSAKQESLATETTLAVIDERLDRVADSGSMNQIEPRGVFGWTLPEGDGGLDSRSLAKWLRQCGVTWVKFPCWLPADDHEAHERVATTMSRLQDSGLHTVGMLDAPPESESEKYGIRGSKNLVAAQLFRDKATWQPQLEPVMTRLTLKVRTWQIGADRDHSFIGRLRLRESISEISEGLQGFGQPIDVAISWPWLEPDSPQGEASWQAVCRSSNPSLGADELDAFLAEKLSDARSEGPRTWLLLDPIEKSAYDRDARILDLVVRMAIVRRHRVQAAFISNPRDPDDGLLAADGRPTELLLPWRTTSCLIGDLRQIGSLEMQSNAQNFVLTGNNRVVMIVWSASPTEELMYLGDDAKIIDVWGRQQDLPVEKVNNHLVQRVSIGRLPKFIVGADPVLLALRMSVSVEPQQLDSLLGRQQKMEVHFTNPTSQPMFGQLHVDTPVAWSIEGGDYEWELQGGRNDRHPFSIALTNEAKVGTYELPIRFDLQSSPEKQITVYRRVTVGPEGLTMEANTKLLRNGDLLVSIEMVNRSSKTLSFDCMLFPPAGRQYLRRLVTIGPAETLRRDFYIEDGEELVGRKMLLRAAEEDGDRILNYEIDIRR